MTQNEYERIMNTLARAIGTQRRFIILTRYEPLTAAETAYYITYRGGFKYRVILKGLIVTEVARCVPV